MISLTCRPLAIQHFVYKNGAAAWITSTKGDDPAGWTTPRLAINPTTQEKHQRPLFPGPGNAIVLSGNHPTHPGRMLFPVWLGPDGSDTSASLFFSDDGGKTFTQTTTTWPKDGNDESTVTELVDGTVLYITRSNTAKCSRGSPDLCLELARSTDGGTTFEAVGASTANAGLRGPPDDISFLSMINNSRGHRWFAFDWVVGCHPDSNWAGVIEAVSPLPIDSSLHHSGLCGCM